MLSNEKSLWCCFFVLLICKCHPSTLISLAVARPEVVSCLPPVVFKGSLQQSLPGFVTIKSKLISFGILRLTSNWCLARRMDEISNLKCQRSCCISRLKCCVYLFYIICTPFKFYSMFLSGVSSRKITNKQRSHEFHLLNTDNSKNRWVLVELSCFLVK